MLLVEVAGKGHITVNRVDVVSEGFSLIGMVQLIDLHHSYVVVVLLSTEHVARLIVLAVLRFAGRNVGKERGVSEVIGDETLNVLVI